MRVVNVAAELKQDFVVAYFWVRYNDQNRSFVPLERMRKFKEGIR